MYSKARTTLSFKGRTSDPVHPSQGVRQGDPLSPLLFLVVFNKVLEKLPVHIGVKFRNMVINHIAFADDLVLLANNIIELQKLINILSETLAEVGLKINSSKSFTLHWVKVTKRKKLIYDNTESITVNNQVIPTLEVTDTFTYLGAAFGTTGLLKIDGGQFRQDLLILQKAPCKPQQKIFMMKNFLIPKYYHSFIFSKLTAGNLNKIDVLVRKTVRSILHLAHDPPKAAFHAKVVDGGMGIPSFRFVIPLIAKHRLLYRTPNEYLLYAETRPINSNQQINNYFKRKLYTMCDGAGLKEASKCPPAHEWVSDGTRFLTGKDYIKSIHLRYGCLYNRARCRRENNKVCRRGCDVPETLNHIIQQCYSTHFLRIKRHNSLVHYINTI